MVDSLTRDGFQDIENGPLVHWQTKAAPDVAIQYWDLPVSNGRHNRPPCPHHNKGVIRALIIVRECVR